MTFQQIQAAVVHQGLILRGAFHPRPDDRVPQTVQGQPAATLVLIGFAGHGGWPSFAESIEARDGSTDPLDRWSRRLVSAMAKDMGASALFPFGGPPWHPFGRWAVRTGEVFPSPLGILIHRQWGLWHSYRGALAFAEQLELPAASHAGPSPCATCEARPCLHACPVSAFSVEDYALEVCRNHLASPARASCADAGCLARRACPIGAENRYDADQTAFFMRAFTGAGA